MKSELKNICNLINEKISANELINNNLASTYVSTESMLPNKRGITKPSSIPSKGTTTAYKKDDVLVSNIRPYFKKIWSANYDGVCSNDVLVFRAKNTADANFLYYVLANDDFFVYSMATSKGTKMPRGDKASIMKYEVASFDLNTQRKIASILKPIDKKIELNNAINNNLEQQAQALFKSWFVDFEPFDGELPSSWTNEKLGNVCNCVLGGTPSRAKPEYWNGTIPWINSGEVNNFRIIKPSETITELGLTKSATKLLPLKTTVIAITGATLGQVSLLEIDACANQSVVGIIPNDDYPYEYIYPLIKQSINELTSHQTGGAQQHINKQNVESLDILVPTAADLDKYCNTVHNLYEMIATNCFENEYLTSLRDTLLPKLMSGELDVSGIDL